MKNAISEIINNKKLKESCAIFLITDLINQSGETFYAFYAIRADIAESFLKTISKQPTEIEKYGVILEAFPGSPSDKILAMVKESFGETAIL